MAFDNENRFRVERTLSRLGDAIRGPLVLTGGLAFRWHAAQNGITVDDSAVNDIDIVVGGLSDLEQTLAEHFLIVHFHPARGDGRILIQLADERERMRVDVFTPSSPTLISRTQAAAVGGISCRIVSVEDLAAKLLAILYNVTRGGHADRKHFQKFKTLSRIVDLDTMRDLWADYRKLDYPEFEVAARDVERWIAKDPTVLRADVYDRDLDAVCAWCENDKSFPLSARSKILEVLGYL